MNTFDMEQDPELGEKMAKQLSNARIDEAVAASAAAEAPVYTPRVKWDVITSGTYRNPRTGEYVAYVDFVVDELLYAVSRKLRGWTSARTEPMAVNAGQVSDVVGELLAMCAKNQRSEMLAAELEAAGVMEGERSEVRSQRSDSDAAPVATHRCNVCGGHSRQNSPSEVQPEGSWSHIFGTPLGKCCDNVPMAGQIGPLV